ncbi:MAG: hypothetical protein LBB56_07195 [Chitinispirillales bacterium]|jgi:hypothetical protein|nr:hypothetical protein [Chitinispirillales bacterium]
MVTDDVKSLSPVIEIMYPNARQLFGDRRCCVSEAGVKYDVGGDAASGTSIKEVNGRKYVDVDLSAEVQKQLDKAANAKEERKIIFQYILKYLKDKKYLTTDNRFVEINRLGAKKITHGASLIKLRVTPHLAELIEIGEFQELVEAKPDKQHKFKHFAYYNVIFKVADTWYKGTLNIGILENGESRLYELNPFREVEETEPPNLHRASRVQAESLTE